MLLFKEICGTRGEIRRKKKVETRIQKIKFCTKSPPCRFCTASSSQSTLALVTESCAFRQTSPIDSSQLNNVNS